MAWEWRVKHVPGSEPALTVLEAVSKGRVLEAMNPNQSKYDGFLSLKDTKLSSSGVAQSFR